MAKKNISPFLDVEIGDLIEVTKFGAWTFSIRGNYSRKSREWDHCSGWFFVVDKWITQDAPLEKPDGTKIEGTHDLLNLELLSRTTPQFWCDLRVWVELDLAVPDDPLFNPKLLNHIKATDK